MADVETFASWGWTCFKNTSLESQTGCFDSSHAEHASAFRRREATCLARASSEEPDWFDLPVMRRIAITTPQVMAALRRLDRDKARPYNFAMSPVIINLSDSPITLLGPFEKNASRWPVMQYINIHDGTMHTSVRDLMPYARSKQMRWDVLRYNGAVVRTIPNSRCE
jgi:hypothetical protein